MGARSSRNRELPEGNPQEAQEQDYLDLIKSFDEKIAEMRKRAESAESLSERRLEMLRIWTELQSPMISCLQRLKRDWCAQLGEDRREEFECLFKEFDTLLLETIKVAPSIRRHFLEQRRGLLFLREYASAVPGADADALLEEARTALNAHPLDESFSALAKRYKKLECDFKSEIDKLKEMQTKNPRWDRLGKVASGLISCAVVFAAISCGPVGKVIWLYGKWKFASIASAKAAAASKTAAATAAQSHSIAEAAGFAADQAADQAADSHGLWAYITSLFGHADPVDYDHVADLAREHADQLFGEAENLAALAQDAAEVADAAAQELDAVQLVTVPDLVTQATCYVAASVVTGGVGVRSKCEVKKRELMAQSASHLAKHYGELLEAAKTSEAMCEVAQSYLIQSYDSQTDIAKRAQFTEMIKKEPMQRAMEEYSNILDSLIKSTVELVDRSVENLKLLHTTPDR